MKIDLAKLCDYLTPLTLAGMVADLDYEMGLEQKSILDPDPQVAEARKVVHDCLVLNVGVKDAARLIDKADKT